VGVTEMHLIMLPCGCTLMTIANPRAFELRFGMHHGTSTNCCLFYSNLASLAPSPYSHWSIR
jgi:hypothetical protein